MIIYLINLDRRFFLEFSLPSKREIEIIRQIGRTFDKGIFLVPQVENENFDE